MDIIKEGIKSGRKKLGLTQQGLADSIHVTRCAIGSYEEGRATPPIEVLVRICALFSITMDKFCSTGLESEKVEKKKSSLELRMENMPRVSIPLGEQFVIEVKQGDFIMAEIVGNVIKTDWSPMTDKSRVSFCFYNPKNMDDRSRITKYDFKI